MVRKGKKSIAKLEKNNTENTGKSQRDVRKVLPNHSIVVGDDISLDISNIIYTRAREDVVQPHYKCQFQK